MKRVDTLKINEQLAKLRWLESNSEQDLQAWLAAAQAVIEERILDVDDFEPGTSQGSSD